MMTTDKNETKTDILMILDQYDLEDKIEILGNVFISLGTQFLDLGKNEIKDVTKYVLDDLDRNGETLANALARQGLIILTWLNRGNKNNGISRNLSDL